MSTRMASDEVTDGIAAIEMHRQGTEKESVWAHEWQVTK